MLSNEIKRLKMKKIKLENLEKKFLKLDTYRRITPKWFYLILDMLSILHYKLNSLRYEASKMGLDFFDTLYNTTLHC